MPRKTIEVATVLERGNHFLANSPYSKQAERRAVANFMEVLLHEADAYAGFSYLPEAGVNYEAIERGEDFDAEDESRRHYSHYNLHVSIR